MFNVSQSKKLCFKWFEFFAVLYLFVDSEELFFNLVASDSLYYTLQFLHTTVYSPEY